MARYFDLVGGEGGLYGSAQAEYAPFATDPYSGAFTISLWYKPDTLTPTNNGHLVQYANSVPNVNDNWAIRHLTTGPVEFWVDTSAYTGDNPNTGSSITLPDSAISHGCWIAYRYAGGTGGAWDYVLNGVVTNIGSKTFSLESAASAGVAFVALNVIGIRNVGSGVAGSLAEYALWTIALTDEQLAALHRGIAADQIAYTFLRQYWPIRGTSAPEPTYASGSRVIYNWGGSTASTHPTMVQPDDLPIRQPAYVLDLYHSTGTRRIATMDCTTERDYDVLGGTYAGQIKNTHSITVVDQLGDAFYGVQQPTRATVIVDTGNTITPDIMGDVALWLKADALLNTYADGDSIATWTDSSTFGNHATQATSGNRPTFQTAEKNGLPIVRFDGSTDYLSMEAALSGTMPATAFCVVKIDTDPPASGTPTGLWLFGTATSSDHYCWTDGIIYDGFGSSARKTTADPSAALSSWRIYEVTTAANAWTNYLDGTQLYTTATNTVAWAATWQLGKSYSTNYLDGDIAELLVFSRVLSATERTQIRQYLSTKWGLDLYPTTTATLLPSMDWRTTRARLRRYERTSHALVTDLTGVVTDAQWGDGEVVLTLESHDTGIWSTLLPTRLITVDEFPSATDLGAPVPVVFGTAQIAAPACGRDDISDPGGSDHLLAIIPDTDDTANWLSVQSIWFDAEPSAPGLELATAWDEAPGSPTYASASSFTITGTLDYRYATGMPVRANCAGAGTWEYSYITTYSSGTITLKHAILSDAIETGCVVEINPTPTAAGTGYAAGDVLTISTGGTLCTVRVREVNSGAVTVLELLTPGQDYTTGTGKSTTGGSGSSCTVEIVTISRGVQLAFEYIVESARYDTASKDCLSVRFPGVDATGGVMAEVRNDSIEHPAYVLKEILRNSTWGLGQSVDASAFTTAYSDCICNGVAATVGYALGGDRQQRRAADVLNELCMILGARLWYDADNSRWSISVDSAPSSATATLEYGTGRNNIKRITRYGRTPLGQAISRLSFRYGTKGRTVATQDIGPVFQPATDFLYAIRASVLGSTIGAQRVITSPWLQSFATAKYVAAYLAKRLKYADRMLECVVGTPEGQRLALGDLVTVRAPHYGLNESMRVRSVQRRLRDATLVLESHDASIYSFSASDITYEGSTSGLTQGDGAADVPRRLIGQPTNMLPTSDFGAALATATIGASTVRGWVLADSTYLDTVTLTNDPGETIGSAYLTLTSDANVGTGSPTKTTAILSNFISSAYGDKTFIFSVYSDQTTGFKLVWSIGKGAYSYPTIKVDTTATHPSGYKRYYVVFRVPASGAKLGELYVGIELWTASTTFKFDAPQLELAFGSTSPTAWKPYTAYTVDPAYLLPGTLAGQRADDPDNQTQIAFESVTKSALSGATVTATALIPAGAYCIGVTAYVKTAITGATSFDIGDGSTADLWGNDIAVAAGTTTDDTDFKSSWTPKYYSSAQDVVLTANGSNFTAGAVVLTAHVIRLTGPATD